MKIWTILRKFWLLGLMIIFLGRCTVSTQQGQGQSDGGKFEDQRSLPDLIVADWGYGHDDQDAIQLNILIFNAGTAPAEAASVSVTSARKEVARSEIHFLESHQEQLVTIACSAEALLEGSVIIHIDPENEIVEVNEENNSQETTVQILDGFKTFEPGGILNEWTLANLQPAVSPYVPSKKYDGEFKPVTPPLPKGVGGPTPTGCPTAKTSPSITPSGGFFPYIISNSQYTTYISLFNDSQYLTDVILEFRDDKGKLVEKRTQTLCPYACYRPTKSNFTGSVDIIGRGERGALQCMIEIRGTGGKGVALAEPANTVFPWGPNWFHHKGVTDGGVGTERTYLVTHNYDYMKSPKSIYVEYGLGQIVMSPDKACPVSIEKQIPARGYYAFYPKDAYSSYKPGPVYVQGYSGPKRTGTQLHHFTGTQFLQGLSDIAMWNFKHTKTAVASWGNYPAGAKDWFKWYFADVRDDGTTRTDRLYFKLNMGSNSGKEKFVKVPVHFFNPSGAKVGTIQVSLLDHFGYPQSYAEISPMKCLGKPFQGSVWIEKKLDTNGNMIYDGALELSIRRESPKKWVALSDASPGRPAGYNCIPFVSNASTEWIYEIVLFYPEANHNKITVSSNDPPKIYWGPTDTVPPLKKGWIYLKFHSMNGQYKGTMAYALKKNETRNLRMDTQISKYIKDFSGSVTIEPQDAVVQLQLWNKNTQCRGVTGNWQGTLFF